MAKKNRKQNQKKEEDHIADNDEVQQHQDDDHVEKEESSSSAATTTTTETVPVEEEQKDVDVAKEEKQEEVKGHNDDEEEKKVESSEKDEEEQVQQQQLKEPQPTPTKKRDTKKKVVVQKKKQMQWDDEEEEKEKEEEKGRDDGDVEEKAVVEKKQVEREQQPPKEVEKPKPKPAPQPAPQQSSGGWGGWFSSISSAVTSTITSITQVDEDEVEPEPYVPPPAATQQQKPKTKKKDEENENNEEEVEGEDGDEKGEDDEDDVEGLLNVVDKGVFKAADMIADSFMFASSLLSTGYKKVQENANMENVNKIANMSLETTKKATNSEIYGKGSKIATQTMDSAVERLESVGASAYSMFSNAKKNIKESISENQNFIKEIEHQQQQVSPTGSTSTSNNSSPSNSNSNIPPPTTSSSTSSSSSGKMKPKINIQDEEVIFKDNEFDAAKCASHFNVPQLVQELERISVESTMKIHQFNRKTPKDIKMKVEQAFNELKELLENESPEFPEVPKNLTNNNESFELEKYYNQYFELLQEYLPTLANQSQPTALSRGLEKLFHFASIGLELLVSVAQHSLDEKPTEDDESMNDVEGIKKWTLSKANIYSYLIFKMIHDIKSISSILIEIIKAKQNPQTRKYLNTISMETNNLTTNINDSRACFISSCSIIFIQQVKSKPFGVPPSPAK